MTWPCASAKTWISMCRPCSIRRSASAHRREGAARFAACAGERFVSSASARTRRMPRRRRRPPLSPAAGSRARASARSVASSCASPRYPARRARRHRACAAWPAPCRPSHDRPGGGPMNTSRRRGRPARSGVLAEEAVAGWMASAPLRRAASTIATAFRWDSAAGEAPMCTAASAGARAGVRVGIAEYRHRAIAQRGAPCGSRGRRSRRGWR